jgi:hypothetical protein
MPELSSSAPFFLIVAVYERRIFSVEEGRASVVS